MGLTAGWGYLIRLEPSPGPCRAKSSLKSHAFKVPGHAIVKCASALARRESIRYFVARRKIPETSRKSLSSLFPNDL